MIGCVIVRPDIDKARAAAERLVALVEMIGRIKRSGAEVSHRRGFVVSGVHDRKFGEVRTFPSWSEALIAAGMEI